MGYKQHRRIVRFGAVSRGLVLPKGWLDFYDFQEGDHLTVLGDSVLVVCHPKDERKARRFLGFMEGKNTQAMVGHVDKATSADKSGEVEGEG